MKKDYKNLEMEVVLLNDVCIITTSGGGEVHGNGTTGENNEYLGDN